MGTRTEALGEGKGEVVSRMRLFASTYFRVVFLLFLLCCATDEALAAPGLIECESEFGVSSVPDVSLLDVWAGVSSFGEAFYGQSHVAVKEFAWIERSPAAIAALRIVHKGAKECRDFYSYAWKKWIFSHDLVVTGGPSCCPFSVSGKRLRQKDPRSTQGLDTAMLAVALGALVLLIENVVNFVEEDHIHELVQEMNAYLLLHGMVAVGIWTLADYDFGGCSGRERVFLRWEEEHMAACLPPLEPEPVPVRPACVLDFVDPLEAVLSSEVGGRSSFERLEAYDLHPSRATIVGFVTLKGPESEWMLGEGLKLKGDSRAWRVLEIQGDWLRILHDSRRHPKFRWVRQGTVSFDQRCAIKWPVYSMCGLAKAIRHTAFAPGDLYLDHRAEHNLVRPLSGREKWRVMGLNGSLSERLVEDGWEEQLGPLAGNSIPGNMTKAVVDSEACRIRKYRCLEKARQQGGFTLMQPKAALCVKGLSLTVLIFVGLAGADVLVWNGAELPCMVHEVTQKQSYDMALRWAQSLGCESVDHCILLEQSMGVSTARATIYYSQSLPRIDGASAVPISQIMHVPAGELAVQALLQVERMVKTVRVGSGAASSWESGRVAGTVAHQEDAVAPLPASSAEAFDALAAKHDEQIEIMRGLLEEDGTEEMLTWEMRLCPTDLTEYPEALRVVFPELSWCGVAVPDPHEPEASEWQPLPQKLNLPERPAPQGWLSAVVPKWRAEAKRRVDSFRNKLTLWLRGDSPRPSAAVIPGQWLEPWVFEAPHDFHSKPGRAVPLDASEVSPSHLNLDFYGAQGEGYPDQEIVSFLVLGVRYKADLPVQIVLQPHLQSFLPVQDKYLKEADRFIDRGWTFCWDSIPLVPFFSAACGSVCRALEPDRPRCTNDAGAPRKELWADDGIRVRSLNECIDEVEWPKEVKPSALDVMIALRVLKEAADILGTSVFMVTDDYKSFFNQLRLSRSEYCKSGVLHPPREGQQLASFAFDTMLGFGIKMASNVAQRFADLLVHIFRRALKPAMQEAIAVFSRKSPKFAEWAAARRKLDGSSPWDWCHDALCHMFMYCDDPCILCVGPDMAFEALKVWTWMSKEGRTMMAIPEKRSFGLAGKWIGVKFFSALGVGSLTAQKAMRACSQMAEACSHSLNRDQYRSLIGFLEHVRAVLFLRGDKMYGLYDALSLPLEPSDLVECTELMHKQFHRMSSRILTQAGSSVTQLPAFLSGAPMSKLPKQLPARRLALFSDAAKEGTECPGLGGWILGYVWTVPLTREHLRLDIPELEAIAAVVNVICAHRIMGGTDCLPEGTCFEAHVDAQATAHVLMKGRARAPMMQLIHMLALQFDGFKEMLPFLAVLHCFGLGNVASDAASRGYLGVLQRIAVALDLKVITVPPPEAALFILDECVKNAGKSRHEFCWGSAGIRFGESDKPGPIFQPLSSRVCDEIDRQGATNDQGRPSKRSRCFEPMGNSVEASLRKQEVASAAEVFPVLVQPSSRVDGPLNPVRLAGILWSDPSEHAICRGDWSKLVECCEVALSTASDAFAQRTSEADSGHWRAWRQYCSTMGTAPDRPAVDPSSDRRGFLREIVLLVNALMYFMRTRKPRSLADQVIKPQSAMNILLGANRVMKANFSSFIPLSNLKLPLKGMMRRFVKRFGPMSLVPKRREPFTNGMIGSLVSLPTDLDLGPVGKLEAGSWNRAVWRAAVALATSTGFRKAEVFRSNETTQYLTWLHLTWIIAGTPVSSPSDEQLKSLREGDYLAVTPVPSKADQFNIVWGAHPLYLPFHEQPRNAPAALRDLALQVGPLGRQPDRPVFVQENGSAFEGRVMATALYKAMSYVVGATRAKLYTWHSARIYLATHMLKCKVPAATIQAMLRWQTDESLRAYARLSMQECGDMLDRAASATIVSVQSANLPLYERFDFFLALHQMAEDA